MHKMVKMILSLGLAFVMNISFVVGMENDDKSTVTFQSKLKESPQILFPFNFTKTFPDDMQKLIVQRIVFEKCLENKSPNTLRVVCKEWDTIVKQEMKVGNKGWKAWYGVLGHEYIYERFLKGVLVYRPNEGSDVGKIELPIAALTNPLESPFDLSNCGDTGKYLSINTGYRKGKNQENAEKVEIWFTPRFLIDKKMPQLAQNHHIKAILENWYPEKTPIRIFWTWSGWNVTEQMSYCDYLSVEYMDELKLENLLKKYQKIMEDEVECLQKFHISFVS